MTDFLIDAGMLQEFLAALTALILIIIAWYNKQRTDIAKSAGVTAAAIAPAAVVPIVITVPATAAPVAYVPVDSRIPGTTQLGVQYWMDAGYKGEEPDAATKAAYTDAQYAYDVAVAQANSLIGKYGDKVSTAIKAISTIKLK